MIRSPFNGSKTRGKAYKLILLLNMEASLKGSVLILYQKVPLLQQKLQLILRQILILLVRILSLSSEDKLRSKKQAKKGCSLPRVLLQVSQRTTSPSPTTKAKVFTGMLIDLDLAKVIGSGRSGARHQTGIMEFMAI